LAVPVFVAVLGVVTLASVAVAKAPYTRLGSAVSLAGVTFPCVVGFVAGCAAGAVLEVYFGLWALALPVVLAVIAVLLGEAQG
jgi:hypothetical protein